MLKRYMLASLVAGLALGAQSAVADNQWFYEGHGWLPQPPFSSERDSRSASVIAGPASVIAGSNQRQAVNPQAGTLPRVTVPAPYDKDGFDAGYFD